MAEVVYIGVNDAAGIQGQLFKGKKFWLSQKVPQRKRFTEEVKVSRRLVARNFDDLEKHAVGPSTGTVRTAGSTIQPPKSARTKFIPEDDQVLINWVHQIEQNGGATSGNEIYKQLEAKNPRHTWQSWRDRWVKSLKTLPRSTCIPQNAPPTPPAERTVDANEPPRVGTPQQAAYKPFTTKDAEDLLEVGDDIMNILPDRSDEAWLKWAEGRDNCEDHTARQWQDFWEKTIRPEYLKRKAEATEGSSRTQRPMNPMTKVDDQARRQQQPTNLVVRTTLSKTMLEGHNASRSPSYHPESPTIQAVVASSEPMTREPTGLFIDGPSDAHSKTGFPGKRKRPVSEEIEEVPSSSPPELIRPTKRLRPDEEEESLFIEIDSISERSSIKRPLREIPDTLATNFPDERHIVYLRDDEDSSDCLNQESCYSEKSHSLSPELGRSPIKTSNDTQRNVSKTQAIFDEPEGPENFDLALPDEGFGDENENGAAKKTKNGAQEDNSEEKDDVDFDLALPDGGFGDENEDKGAKATRNGVQRDNLDDLDNDDEVAEEFHSLEEEQPQNTEIKYPALTDPDNHSIPPSSPPGTSPRPHQPTTQAILTAETQHPDFSLPAPEGGWDAALLPSSPPELPPSSPPDVQHQNQPSHAHPPRTHQHQTQVPRTPSPNPADQLDDFIDYHISQGYSEDTIHLALKCTNMDPALTMEVLETMRRNGEKVPRGMKGCWTEEDDGDLESVDARRIKRVEEKHGVGGVEARWMFLEEYRR
ncbi:MAG: hypothetical protein LQ343_006366 [Gyalolechia ehrenbergii]|nr:MAG: hypothetical protein LQ343_006366 [Gyalolechia ehrenbergii]